MKKRYRWLFFLIGVAGIVALAFSADIEGTDWNDLFDEKLPAILALQLILWLGIYLLHTDVYRKILREAGAIISFGAMLKICVSGFALNSVTPAGLVGGEPYRIMELKRYCTTEKAASGTLTFSLLYVMGHVMMWITGILIYFCMGCPGDTGITILFSVAGFFLALVSFLFLRSRDHAFMMSTARALTHLPFFGKRIKRLLAEKQRSIEAVDEGIRRFSRNKQAFRKAFLWEYLSRLLEAMEYFLILSYLGERITVVGGILVMSTASLMGNLFFIIPMQAGTRESGTLLALRWLGIEPSAGILAGLLYRTRDFFCILIGIAGILIERRVKGKEV